jgi:hypothetical protein
MNRTPEYRLKVIKAEVAIAISIPLVGQSYQALMVKIAFLTDMPALFLDRNKDNYAEAIKLADADITMEI